MLRRRLMAMARGIYCWIRVKSVMAIGRRLNGETSPGGNAKSRKVVPIGRAVDGVHWPAKDILSVKAMRLGRDTDGQSAETMAAGISRAMRMGRGKISAYSVQLIVSIREFVIGYKANGEAAPGEIGIGRKKMRLEETTDGERAGAVTTKTKRVARTGRVADGGAYYGLIAKLGRALRMGNGSVPERAPAKGRAAQRAAVAGVGCESEAAPAADGVVQMALAVGAANKVAAATWIGPTQISGSLFLRQARGVQLYDARVGGNGLEVR